MKIYNVPKHRSDFSKEENEMAVARMKTFILSGFNLEQEQCKKLRRKVKCQQRADMIQ